MKHLVCRLALSAVLGSATFESGCAYFSKAASVQAAVVPEGSAKRAGRVAVPVLIQEKFKVGLNPKSWADGPLTDRLVTGLLRQGYLVVDRATIRTILKANGLSYEDIQREDNLTKIGELLEADVVVLGRLTLVEHADGQAESRKVTVRGIRARDGMVVFSFSAVDTTMYRSLTGETLIDQGLDSMFGIVPQKKTSATSATTKEPPQKNERVIEKTVQVQLAPKQESSMPPPLESETSNQDSASPTNVEGTTETTVNAASPVETSTSGASSSVAP
jgi:hypothetical protein